LLFIINLLCCGLTGVVLCPERNSGIVRGEK